MIAHRSYEAIRSYQIWLILMSPGHLANGPSLVIGLLALQVPAALFAQPSASDPSVSALQTQLQEMHSQMEKMQRRIDELEASRTTSSAPPAVTSNQPTEKAGAGNQQAVRAATSDEQSVEDALQQQDLRLKKLEEPDAFHYKGVTLTPGGYLEGSLIFRTRNMNADIGSTFSGIPLNGSTNSKLTEFRGSARNSELSLKLESKPAVGKTITAYAEIDFLGAAPAADYVQSSSWSPRLRQLWVQLSTQSGWAVTAGQMWSLLTSNRQGIATLQELRPTTADGGYVVGFTWTRERAVRVTKDFNNWIWAAFAIEDPENKYSAGYLPPNVMGLNTSSNASTGVNLLPYLPNYSNGHSTELAPDLVAKVAFEPGWGHYEIKALGRIFRDRIASTSTTQGVTHVSEGWGVGFNALMPITNRLEVSAEGFMGEGIGRYGASGLPDVTLDATTAKMLPLRQARVLLGAHLHPTPRLDLYVYAGDEYTERHGLVSPTGGPAGYGSPLVSYTNCNNEVALNACKGANRNIFEGTVGYWYRILGGNWGRLEYGNQVAYLQRSLWSGIGHPPEGSDSVVYSTMRVYLP